MEKKSKRRFDCILDPEEQEMLDSFERGEWVSVPNEKEEIQRARVMAAKTLRRHSKKKTTDTESVVAT